MYVLDASALLAVSLAEKGADAVTPHLRGAEVSIVNVCEVLTKPFGLGFGDRACLVQGLFGGMPILTGDQDGMKLNLDPARGIDIRLIR